MSNTNFLPPHLPGSFNLLIRLFYISRKEEMVMSIVIGHRFEYIYFL